MTMFVAKSVAGTKIVGTLDAVSVVSPVTGTTVTDAAGVVDFVGGIDVEASSGSSICGANTAGTDAVFNRGAACVVGGCVSALCGGGVEISTDGAVCLVEFVRVGGVDSVEMVLTSLFLSSLYN